MMQDWLTKHKLDRKVLANLASNLLQVEAYEAYLAHEVEAVLDGLVQAVMDSEQPTAQEAAQTMMQAPTIPVPDTTSGVLSHYTRLSRSHSHSLVLCQAELLCCKL